MSEREGLDGGWWKCPRWLGDELIDGRITRTTFALVALVGSRRDAEPGGPGFSTTGTWLADALEVTDRTIRNARRQACEDGLLAEEGVAGRATIRLWLGPRFRGVSEVASEVASEVGSEDTSETPGPAIDLNPILEAASDDPEPRNLARAHARAPRRRQETETSSTSTSVEGRHSPPTSFKDPVVAAGDSSLDADVDAAVQDEALRAAGDGDGEREVGRSPSLSPVDVGEGYFTLLSRDLLRDVDAPPGGRS